MKITNKIWKWANDRNIIKGSTPKDQFCKLTQEVGELSESICESKTPIDDIGDIGVVLVILAAQHGLTLKQCLKHSYREIKDRKGTMVDGVFFKG